MKTKPSTWNKNDKIAVISRLRRNVIVHSIIYYQYNRNLISDSAYDKMCQRLAKLQIKYPKTSAKCCYPKAFRDYDPSTGFNFVGHKWGTRAAERLLRSK